MSKLSQSLAGFCIAVSLTAIALANDAPPTDETTATPSSESTAAEPADAPAAAASDAETATPAAPADEASPADTTLAANAAAQAEKIADDPIICKRVEVTGTRLRKGKVCQAKSEWQKMADGAQSMMKDVDRKSSPGPGGQTLPPGG